jgi:putative ABC transport system permease protein
MLVYLYRRRLRVHLFQELLAGFGVAVAVALLFAVTVADRSVEGSAGEVVHAVVGPANLQLRARGGDGFDERLIARVERLPGVSQAAPVLEQTASVIGPDGRRATVQIAGAVLSLALLDGLAHTIPLAAFSAAGIGLSQHTAGAIGIPTRPLPAPAARVGERQTGRQPRVLLELRGRAVRLPVSAVLNPTAFGALVESKPGQAAAVRGELSALAGDRLAVAPADEDDALLRQALRPSDQSSEFFAAICALLGFLFAFNAILLTVPERRQAIADLRLLGMRRVAIVQMVLFQALCLGLGASLVGLLAGYALAGLPRRRVHARREHGRRGRAAAGGARRRRARHLRGLGDPPARPAWRRSAR